MVLNSQDQNVKITILVLQKPCKISRNWKITLKNILRFCDTRSLLVFLSIKKNALCDALFLFLPFCILLFNFPKTDTNSLTLTKCSTNSSIHLKLHSVFNYFQINVVKSKIVLKMYPGESKADGDKCMTECCRQRIIISKKNQKEKNHMGWCFRTC